MYKTHIKTKAEMFKISDWPSAFGQYQLLKLLVKYIAISTLLIIFLTTSGIAIIIILWSYELILKYLLSCKHALKYQGVVYNNYF